MTFLDPRSDSEITVTDNKFPPIPQTVTSFGAAIAGDSLYLYGGHSGRAHEYYAEAQGKTLWRLDLSRPEAWESLGDGPGLQGLAMVAHDGKLYRIGGFTAKNSDGEKEDLWSQAGVASFDPATDEWKELPPLPEPRSSFDAAVLGDKIYVVGGWTMRGDTDAQWLQTAHVLDLGQEPLAWDSLPPAPFERRALSVAAHDGKIYVLGGMQRVGGPTTRVDIFDPETRAWSRGPGLQGGAMDGFGSSAFAVGNQLFVTTYSGSIQRLDEDADSWQVLGQLDRQRFFHRLLPLSDNELIAVGGASMSDGNFETLEVIRVR